ncbi:MAG: 3-oxoacyl-ACP reductase FabG [Alphaproteobacteria bacterium]
MYDFSGKVALVTGGSRGIGAASARLLAQGGASVAITYSSSADQADAVVAEITKQGGKAIAIKSNASSPSETEALVPAVVEAFGKLDILVNNAGVLYGGHVSEASDEDLQKTIAVNVEAVFRLSRAAAKVMPEGGRIVNIGSVMGERALTAGASVYVMSKFAVSGLTRGLAHDLAGQGITVNTVQPGPVDTTMNPADGDHADAMTQMVPMGRYGQADEIAAAVAFLASDAASYITGAKLNVDGGMNA